MKDDKKKKKDDLIDKSQEIINNQPCFFCQGSGIYNGMICANCKGGTDHNPLKGFFDNLRKKK